MRTLATLLTVAAALIALGASAAAQDDDPGTVTVAEVSGLLDPVLADFIEEQIDSAAERGDRLLVLRVNSSAAVISDERLNELALQIVESPVPVAAWVGPSGSRASGEVAQLVGVTVRVGVAPGARIGDTGEQVLDPDVFGTVWGESAPLLRNDTLNWEQVIDLGVIPCERVEVDELGRTVSEDDQRLRCAAPLVGDFLVQLEDFGFESREVESGDEIRREPVTVVRFTSPSLIEQLFHTFASPPFAYLLFVAGVALMIFEFYTGGIGVAGVVGALAFLAGCYGLAVLPTNTYAIVLLLIGCFGFAVDVQTGVPRAWSAIGAGTFAIGTLTLFQSPASMSWIPITVGIGGMILAMIGGMPAMVRTRFSTPTIGREWMVGEMGEAVEAVNPNGVVRIRDALWRAHTNRATPISEGDAIRVIAIEGLVLEVEPESGGARDYRDRRQKR